MCPTRMRACAQAANHYYNVYTFSTALQNALRASMYACAAGAKNISGARYLAPGLFIVDTPVMAADTALVFLRRGRSFLLRRHHFTVAGALAHMHMHMT